MSSRSTCSSFHSLLLFCLFFSIDTDLSIASDTISPGQSLSGNQTIVSKDGLFELGFFTPGNSQNYYIGIWYKKISEQTVIWVANREKPVSNSSSSELKISEDGNLVLLGQSKLPFWSSNSTSSTVNSTIAVLLDTGNLVLRHGSNSSAIIWQSFDHPTDTWVPGGWLGVNMITGEQQSLTSWKNSEEPSPGPFSLALGPDGLDQQILQWNGSEIYWKSGEWNGRYFSLIPEMARATIYNFSYIKDHNQSRLTFTVLNSSIITRLRVDVSGQLKQWTWIDSDQEWVLHWIRPQIGCGVYSLCGAFGICNPTGTSFCSCPHGFEPASPREWDLNDWSGGCIRKTNLQCGNKSSNNGEDGYLMMPNIELPQNSQSLMTKSMKECELACSNNCSCTAYAYQTGCLIWVGDLRNIQQPSDGDSGSGNLYLRLPASELPKNSSCRTNSASEIVSVTVAALTGFLFILLGLTWRYQRKRLSEKARDTGSTLVRFSYGDLRRITKNFSKNLGRGSFGPVFKGVLPYKTAVAVKRLEGLQHGEKQFQAEVSTLGTIQHVNLVRLRGFCCKGAERLLVYDYMPNGSLDSHLFGNDSKRLDWRTRYQIIVGVAKGLKYLHKNCRECIIHCDIKPENILLDGDFCPKVADFGMAKLIGRDLSRVLTTLRGTIGYLAPEWISGVPITTKVDVYGFGMMVFEVISGRRNMEHPKDGDNRFFPVWAAMKVNEGEVLTLLDERLEGDADMEELSRACRVACWCIQDSEDDRPTMGEVVHVLEGVLEVNMPPIPRSLQHLIQDHDPTAYTSNVLQSNIAQAQSGASGFLPC